MALTPKRINKENEILDAAEIVFQDLGFNNARMELVGQKAGVSKATVYFYFESKENLYMAIVFRALTMLNNLLYESIHQHQQKQGLTSVLALMSTYVSFSEKYPLYMDTLLDYLALVRQAGEGPEQSKLTDAIKESLYFKKIQHIHNLPVTLVVQELNRGMADGSVNSHEKPEILYLTAWALVLGFLKLTTTGGKRKTIHTVDIQEWKEYMGKMLEKLLKN